MANGHRSPMTARIHDRGRGLYALFLLTGLHGKLEIFIFIVILNVPS